MRYRRLSRDGDMTFGHGTNDFYRDQPEAVGQAVETRLALFRGEWFLDLAEGTPWGGFPFNDFVVMQGKILGAHTTASRDVAIKTRILGTDGVSAIVDYSSHMDPDTRAFSVSCRIDTIYGQAFLLTLGSGTSFGFEIGVTPLDSTVPVL